METNIVDTFARLNREQTEIFLTNEGFLWYGVLLEKSCKQQKKPKKVKKDGKVYKLITFKGA